MKAFMDQDFLLETETARKLFHDYAEKTPILDYHCHISPKEIAENRQFENITQVWLGGDHYKWRFMRSCGVDEKYITGDASDREKFQKWAECLGKAIGNPLYHWSHLELQRYFGYNGHLCAATAEEVWNLCNAKLADPSMTVRNIIKQSNVTLICTTDDPIDTLEYHRQIKEDPTFDVKVLPAWRPDKAMNLEKPDYKDYLKKLAAAAGMTEIRTFHGLCHALKNRMDFFAENGCLVSDHALEFVMFYPASEDEIEEIFLKRLNNVPVTKEEEYKFKTAFMLFVAREYHRRDWVLQLHAGAKRDNNTPMYDKLGPVINEKVKVLIVMGETADLIEQSAKQAANYNAAALEILHADSMEQAVALARAHAHEGDVVSLSPASTSFDKYKNFERRGQHFKQVVNALS